CAAQERDHGSGERLRPATPGVLVGRPRRSGHGIAVEKPSLEWFEPPLGDRAPEAGHEPEEEVNVVQAEESEGEQLLGKEEVTEIRAREPPAGVAGTIVLEWPGVARILRVLDHERPLSREALAVARVPRGQHAVEEIHALADRLDQILWLAHAHEIAWLRRWQAPFDARRQCVHERLRLADGHSADGVAVEAQRHRLGDGALAHIVPGATLNDPEQRSLARAPGVG